MASYSTVRYGSRGDDVRALQNALNSAGYDLDVDGIFGKKTQAAVREYQASNGLTVDGIVGKNTWGALNSAPSSSAETPTTAATAPTVSSPTVSAPTVDTAAKEKLTAQLESLIAQFNSTPGYTPKTEEEIRKQAEGEYQSYYDQLRLAAQQQQEKSDLALAQQRDQLATTYQKQKDASEKEYAGVYSTADRQMLSRGMQRSSYAAQTLANIDAQGAQAQQAIADAQAEAEGNVDEQRAQLAQQLAAQLAQYDASEAADVLNRIREIEDQEYERGMEATDRKNSLSAQIYEIMYQQQRDQLSDEQWQAQFEYQQQRDQIEDAQWQKQFDESVRQYNASKKSSSSSSSSSSKKSSTTAPTVNPTAPSGMSYADFMNALNSGSSSSTSGSSSSGNWLSRAVSGVGNALSSVLKKTSGAASDVDAVSGAAVSTSKRK